jgi:TRAP-type C4-dicarboxylate transport system substrate-binding protein
MKKIAYIAMAVVFIFAIAQVPMVQAASETKLTKISLKYADHIPAMSGGNVFIKQQYLPRIQEQLAKIGYELDITFYHAGSLYKYSDQVQACDQGLLDMTVAVMSYELGRAPLHEVCDFSFMGWDGLAMNRVWIDLNETIPEFRAELSGFKELFRFVPTRRLLHHNIDGAKVPEDFKGKKIHASGMGADLFRSIGAVPIRQNPGDWYTSLDRGLFEGINVAFDMVGIMKLYEVLKYHIFPAGDGFGFTPVTHLMNRKKFESLPPGVQKVFEDNILWASEAMTLDELNRLPSYQEGAKKKGNKFIDLTEEETEKWRAAVKPVHEKWVEDMEKKGLPGRKVYEEAKRLSKKYMKK